MNGMSLHPYPKGAPVGRQISIPPFDMTSHPLTSLPCTDTNSIWWSAEKCSCSRSHSWSKDSRRLTKNSQRQTNCLTKPQNRWWSIIQNSSRSIHAQCRNFWIQNLSVAKTRCRNTRFSPKTPEVFPVLNSSSKSSSSDKPWRQ